MGFYCWASRVLLVLDTNALSAAPLSPANVPFAEQSLNLDEVRFIGKNGHLSRAVCDPCTRGVSVYLGPLLSAFADFQHTILCMFGQVYT